jgi:hypothetical protein
LAGARGGEAKSTTDDVLTGETKKDLVVLCGDGEKDDSADEGEDIDMSNRWLFASLCLVTLVDLVHE